MSGMKTSRQAGFISALLLWVIILAFLFVCVAGFAAWAFMGRQDYKNHSDDKAAAAALQSKKDTQAADAVQYAEEAKNPLKTYVGPSQFGSVTVQYPKTWSAYVVEDARTATPVDTFFHPDTVPNVANLENSYSLRIRVVQQPYDQVLNGFTPSVKNNKVTVSPYALPKVPTVVGSRVDGQITTKKQGSMILLPMRNLTLEIWAEAAQYQPDFNNIILPNMTFSP